MTLEHPNLVAFHGVIVVEERPSSVFHKAKHGNFREFIQKEPGEDRIPLVRNFLSVIICEY